MMDSKSIVTHPYTLLFVVAGIAFALRIWGVTVGLPQLLHPDECFEINRALRLATGQFDWDRTGKGGLYYILFAEMALTYVFMHLTGLVEDAAQFAAWFVAHEHYFYLAGRVTSVFFSVGSVILVFVISRRLFGWQLGLVTATLMALTPVAIIEGHYSTVDDPLVFFLLCSWLYLIKAVDDNFRRNWILAGVFSGFALMTKLTAIVNLVPLAMALPLARSGTVKYSKIMPNWILMILIFITVSVIGEPGYVKNMNEMLVRYSSMFTEVQSSEHQLESDSPSVEKVLQPQVKRNLFQFYGNGLIAHAGWTSLLFAGAGAIFLFWYKLKYTLLLLGFSVPYFFIICSTNTNLYYMRYLLPLLPVVYLLATGLIYIFIHKLQSKYLYLVVSMSAVILVAPKINPAITAAAKDAKPQTRIVAKDWIEQNIPAGSSILMEGGREHRSQYSVPLYNTISNIDHIISDLEQRAPGKARYWRLKKEALSNLDVPRYDLHMVMHHDLWPALNKIKQRRIEYIVVESRKFDPPIKHNIGKALTSRIEFYSQINTKSDIRLLKVIMPNLDISGQKLEIFKIYNSNSEYGTNYVNY